ncbi:MAG: sulfatase-like hydrolase/transferase [Acidobacteria bacterium]|nr:sulfatase-like hydrolase/transferase [Acidobacteriota bacterium]
MFTNYRHKKYSLLRACTLMTALVLGALTGCKAKPDADNVLLITLDTQRADFISAYFSENARTPFIDSLAEEGTLFENCYALIPITLPSHASLFFSQPPHELKNYNNGQIIHPKRKRPPLTTFLKKRGYATAAFISLGVMQAKFGLNEAFDTYSDQFPLTRWYLTAEEVNEQVFPWLEENAKTPFFAWVHYSDPHDPYSPPTMPNDFRVYLNDDLLYEACLRKYEVHELNMRLKPGVNKLFFEVDNSFIPNPDHFRAKMDQMEFSTPPGSGDLDIDLTRGWFVRRDNNVFFFKDQSFIDIINHQGPRDWTLTFRGSPVLNTEAVRSLYQAEVEYMDAQFGRLLAKLKDLGLTEKTKIILIGDHGEGLGDHTNINDEPHFGHIQFLNNIYLKVPFIIYDPDRPKSSRRTDYVTPLDVTPTILAMLGIRGYPSFFGKNLLDRKPDMSRSVFQETYKPEADYNKFAVLSPPWHLIFTPETRAYELYNMETDPEEKNNLFDASSLPAGVAKLKKDLDNRARDIIQSMQEIHIDEKTKEMLRSLGYIK